MGSFFKHTETEFQEFVVNSLDDVHQKINLILQYLNIFYTKEKTMAFDLSTVLAQVKQERTVEASLMALVTGLNQKIAELTANVVDENAKAQLAELNAALTQNLNDMQNAVTANTPAVAPASSPTTVSPDTSTTVTPPAAGTTPTVATDATTVNPPAADATSVVPDAPAAPVATPTSTVTTDTPAADATPTSNS